MKTETISFEIQEELNKATQAINTLVKLNHKSAPNSIEEKKGAEYNVHLTTRQLYLFFHSDATWAMEINTETKRAVGNVLRKATRWVRLDKNCVKSVNRRLQDFNKLMRDFKNKRARRGRDVELSLRCFGGDCF